MFELLRFFFGNSPSEKGFIPESSGDKLGAFSQFVNHVSHSFSMLSVKGSVDLVKEVERCRIALLNGKNHSLKNQISLDQIPSNVVPSNCKKIRLYVKTAVDIFKMKN